MEDHLAPVRRTVRLADGVKEKAQALQDSSSTSYASSEVVRIDARLRSTIVLRGLRSSDPVKGGTLARSGGPMSAEARTGGCAVACEESARFLRRDRQGPGHTCDRLPAAEATICASISSEDTQSNEHAPGPSQLLSIPCFSKLGLRYTSTRDRGSLGGVLGSPEGS